MAISTGLILKKQDPYPSFTFAKHICHVLSSCLKSTEKLMTSAFQIHSTLAVWSMCTCCFWKALCDSWEFMPHFSATPCIHQVEERGEKPSKTGLTVWRFLFKMMYWSEDGTRWIPEDASRRNCSGYSLVDSRENFKGHHPEVFFFEGHWLLLQVF